MLRLVNVQLHFSKGDVFVATVTVSAQAKLNLFLDFSCNSEAEKWLTTHRTAVFESAGLPVEEFSAKTLSRLYKIGYPVIAHKGNRGA